MQTLFKHSESANPYPLYAVRLQQTPVYYDANANLWAVYSYAGCNKLLHHPSAIVPPLPVAAGLNDYAVSTIRQLTRLSNAPAHEMLRRLTLQLFQRRRPVTAGELLTELLANKRQTDWVHVSRQLPLLHLLRSLGFAAATISYALQHITTLVTLLFPQKTPEQVTALNPVMATLYELTAQHLQQQQHLLALITDEQVQHAAVSNLIGLMIQCYDAGRGLLCNTLLQLLSLPSFAGSPPAAAWFYTIAVETARHNPPIHNTRRLLTSEVLLHHQLIPANSQVLLVLAAANRDAAQFRHPGQFDSTRVNNHEQLSFGTGMHACIAKHESLQLAADCMASLFTRYPALQPLFNELSYEPLVNARLPVSIPIKLY